MVSSSVARLLAVAAAVLFGPGDRVWRRRLAVALAAAVLWPLGAAVTELPAPAKAEFWPAGVDFWVNSEMGPIKSRVFRAKDGNTSRVVYALDGLRATNDISGWEHQTDVAQLLTSWNINVVMPVGGQSSFYSDWIAPSTTNQQSSRYVWETFLTRDLRNALAQRLHFQPFRNGVFGLSMGGSAALTLAAYHPDQFDYAGSFSGFLNISAPMMPEMIRVAMLDAGYFNVDNMWGPPWSPLWRRNDPFVFATLLQAENIRLYVAAGVGIPTWRDIPQAPIGVFNDITGMGLEMLAAANTGAFQARLSSLGYDNVVYDITPYGIHNWPYWIEDAMRMAPDLSAHIG